MTGASTTTRTAATGPGRDGWFYGFSVSGWPTKAHFHDRQGLPVCGSGWFGPSTRQAEGDGTQRCKGCMRRAKYEVVCKSCGTTLATNNRREAFSQEGSHRAQGHNVKVLEAQP